MTAVINLSTASACNAMEREMPELASLLNAIDLDRKEDPDVMVVDDVLEFEEQEGHSRDSMDTDGVLLLGNGRSAVAQEVCALRCPFRS
jgi:hypothetical protein